MKFLDAVADHIYSHYKAEELESSIEIILPSRRSGLHLKKALATRYKVPFIAPKFFTIDEYFKTHFEFEVVGNLEAQFELFAVYKELHQDPGTLDSFISWSDQILKDFNEIDRYLIDPKDLFRNLKDIKEIESWNFDFENLSANQKKYLEFWELLGKIYYRFHERLASKNKCLSGQMYRRVAENPIKYLQTKKKPIIAGFNALSESEKSVFKYLEVNTKASFFWNTDLEFLDNKHYEAGHFLRQTRKELGGFNNIKSQFIHQNKEITFYRSNSNTDQINVASSILSTLEGNSNTKGLILANEGLLPSLTINIPTNIEAYNITMGLPLNQSQSFSYLDLIFEVLSNSRRYSSKGTKRIHFKDFNLLVNHPLFVHLASEKEISLDRINNTIKTENISFIELDFLKENAPKLYAVISPLWSHIENISKLLRSLQTHIDDIRKTLFKKEYFNLEIDGLYRISEQISVLSNVNDQYNYLETIQGMRNLLKGHLGNESIPFYGEPLQGLQIMGLLETRSIDFDEVILLSCNEQFLPGINHLQSLIPTDLRIYFGLPSKYEREAIFAYYFYSLILRSKKIHLIYNDGIANGIEDNEMSRYLLQLRNICSGNEHFNLQEKQFASSPGPSTPLTQITKDQEYLIMLSNLYQSGLSPSALNTFQSCELDFYYKYVLRIGEVESLEEQIETSTLGDIIHETLEELYKGTQLLNKTNLKEMNEKYIEQLDRSFQKRFPYRNYKKGKNYLTYKMAQKAVEEFLKMEALQTQKNGVIKIIGLETKYEFHLESDQINQEVLFKGKADRVDSIGDQIRIIDYKSGFVTKSDLSARDFQGLIKKPKAFQVYFYAYLYYKSTGVFPTSGIISMRNLKAGLMNIDSKWMTPDYMNEFETFLIELLLEMQSSTTPITHNPKAKFCSLCEI